MTKATLARVCAVLTTLSPTGCDDGEVRPPDIVYGEDACERCEMIINDDRYACAALVEAPDARRATLLFDDVNCLVEHELKLESAKVLKRWVHDAESRAWLEAGHAVFLQSVGLETPMASGVAAFASDEGAKREQARHAGVLCGFASVQERFVKEAQAAGRVPGPGREGH